ncbi:hypothetical protein [Streptomyces sp. NPDC026673]|uniref:hypothetical protein n=1 Tax=Streptomyces sp. NPDC026673 TaxID=3155724 RepID=UPI003408D2D1
MFTPGERDRVRARLLGLAADDEEVTGAAVTGSLAFAGGGDRWSDIDLVLGVRGVPSTVLARWTGWLYGPEFGALHHWDLQAGATVYRVFLLPGALEADLAFTPEEEFGPRGPQWRTVFGVAGPVPDPEPVDPGTPAGLGWHHVLHAAASIDRGRLWQAEHWIGAVRTQVIALACLRLGHPAAYAKGAHLLPEEVTEPLRATLVRSPEPAELRRALAAAATALGREVDRADPALAQRLWPVLVERGGAAG